MLAVGDGIGAVRAVVVAAGVLVAVTGQPAAYAVSAYAVAAYPVAVEAGGCRRCRDAEGDGEG